MLAQQWFRGLKPTSQVIVLQTIATLKAWQLGRDALPVAHLLFATPEQRQAAQKIDKKIAEDDRRSAKRVRSAKNRTHSESRQSARDATIATLREVYEG